MDTEEFKNLAPGDIVQHKGGETATVMANFFGGARVTAVRSYDLTNPQEWELVAKASLRMVRNRSKGGGR